MTALFDEAFRAVVSGHPERHDAILRKGLVRLMARCRTVLLAQASMARVVPSLEIPEGTRILTSSESGVAQIAQVLKRRVG